MKHTIKASEIVVGDTIVAGNYVVECISFSTFQNQAKLSFDYGNFSGSQKFLPSETLTVERKFVPKISLLSKLPETVAYAIEQHLESSMHSYSKAADEAGFLDVHEGTDLAWFDETTNSYLLLCEDHVDDGYLISRYYVDAKDYLAVPKEVSTLSAATEMFFKTVLACSIDGL